MIHKTAIIDLQNFDSDRYIILSYENLVEYPQKEMQRIIDKLGIKQNLKLNIINTTKDRKTFNTNTKGNPLNDWKDRLTSVEIETIEKVKSYNKTDYEIIQGFLK